MMEININNNLVAKRVGMQKNLTLRMPTTEPQDIFDEAQAHITVGDEITISVVQGAGVFDNNFEAETTTRVLRKGFVTGIVNGKAIVDWVQG